MNPGDWAFSGLTGANSGPSGAEHLWRHRGDDAALAFGAGVHLADGTPERRGDLGGGVDTGRQVRRRGGGGGEERVGGVVLGLERVLGCEVADHDVHDLRRRPVDDLPGDVDVAAERLGRAGDFADDHLLRLELGLLCRLLGDRRCAG